MMISADRLALTYLALICVALLAPPQLYPILDNLSLIGRRVGYHISL